MLLSEVLNSRVHCDDEPLGVVVDARFALDGTPNVLQAQARLLGLIVGPKPRAAFLGYERTAVNAPALIARFFLHRQRGSFLILYEDIERIDNAGVRVRRGFTRWSPLLTDTDRQET